MDHLTNTKTQVVLMQSGQVPLLYTITAPVLEYVLKEQCVLVEGSYMNNLHCKINKVIFTNRTVNISLFRSPIA